VRKWFLIKTPRNFVIGEEIIINLKLKKYWVDNLLIIIFECTSFNLKNI
jgi:hypothetical protein